MAHPDPVPITDPALLAIEASVRRNNRRQSLIVAGLVLLVAAALIAGFTVRSNDLEKVAKQNRTLVERIESTTRENRAALLLLCGVSDSFVAVLANAANQIEKSERNGTYERLLERGIITQENIDAARRTKESYRSTIRQLAGFNACDRLALQDQTKEEE